MRVRVGYAKRGHGRTVAPTTADQVIEATTVAMASGRTSFAP